MIGLRRYQLIMVILVPLFASVGMLIVALERNQSSIDRERRSRVASEQALCQIYGLLDASYRRSPPTTPAGKSLATAVAAAMVVNSCPRDS